MSSSDSLDGFCNFDKLKPYDSEATVSDNENTDREVSSSVIHTKGAEKERKANAGKICRKFFLTKMNPFTLLFENH